LHVSGILETSKRLTIVATAQEFHDLVVVAEDGAFTSEERRIVETLEGLFDCCGEIPS